MLRDEENKKEKKNNQKLSIIAELIEELKVKTRTAANKYITTSTNHDEGMSQEDEKEDEEKDAVVNEDEEGEEVQV